MRLSWVGRRVVVGWVAEGERTCHVRDSFRMNIPKPITTNLLRFVRTCREGVSNGW